MRSLIAHGAQVHRLTGTGAELVMKCRAHVVSIESFRPMESLMCSQASLMCEFGRAYECEVLMIIDKGAYWPPLCPCLWLDGRRRECRAGHRAWKGARHECVGTVAGLLRVSGTRRARCGGAGVLVSASRLDSRDVRASDAGVDEAYEVDAVQRSSSTLSVRFPVCPGSPFCLCCERCPVLNRAAARDRRA